MWLFDQAFDRDNVLYRPILGESNVKFKREHIVLLLSGIFGEREKANATNINEVG